MRFIKLAVVAGMLVTANSFAQEKYDIDLTHSNIGFSVRHMVVAKVPGNFKEFSGAILYDEKDLTKSSVNVTIKAGSINTQNDRRDGHLRSADFFDAENHPDITFVSKKITKTKDGFTALGDLTIRGTTKEVELPFKILGTRKDARGARMGIEAGLTLNRFDYGVKWDKTLDDGNLIVSNEVAVAINLEVVANKPQ